MAWNKIENDKTLNILGRCATKPTYVSKNIHKYGCSKSYHVVHRHSVDDLCCLYLVWIEYMYKQIITNKGCMAYF